MSSRSFRIALLGNPNTGKTTIFNALAGVRHRVANYPGTTVECREARVQWDGTDVTIMDLPGTYALTSHSEDERVARRALIEDRPDLVVQVLDASNLERNLYLTAQLLDLEVPLVLALNMSDLARQSGVQVEPALLAQLLGVPVVATVARRGEGISALADTIRRLLTERELPRGRPVRYGDDLEQAISEITRALASAGEPSHPPL